jgi:hypothetical protein
VILSDIRFRFYKAYDFPVNIHIAIVALEHIISKINILFPQKQGYTSNEPSLASDNRKCLMIVRVHMVVPISQPSQGIMNNH